MRQHEVLSRRNRGTRVLVALFLAIATLLGLAIRPTPAAHAVGELNVTQSNPDVVSTVTGDNTNVFTLNNYEATPGDVVTFTLPNGYFGSAQADIAQKGYPVQYFAADGSATTATSTTNQVRSVVLKFTEGQVINNFRVTLTPNLPNYMVSAMRSTTSTSYMVPGNYTVTVTATNSTDASAQQSTSLTFNAKYGTTPTPLWTTMSNFVLRGVSFVRNVDYTLNINQMISTTASASLTYPSGTDAAGKPSVCASNAADIHLFIPGGFTLNSAASTAGWSQSGEELIWTNPSPSDSAPSTCKQLNLVGKWTNSAGIYRATKQSYFRGYIRNSGNIFTIRNGVLDSENQTWSGYDWSLTIVNSQPPTFDGDSDATAAMVGNTGNKQKHPELVAFDRQLSLYNSVSEDQNDVQFDVPQIDGAALIGQTLVVQSTAGQTINIDMQKKSESTQTTTTYTLSKDNATYPNQWKDDGQATSFTVKIPETTSVDPYTYVFVSISKVSRTNATTDEIDDTVHYQALATNSAGNAPSGLVTSSTVTATGAGATSGVSWTLNANYQVRFYNSLTATGDVACGSVASETTAGAAGCNLAFGASSTVSMQNLGIETTDKDGIGRDTTARISEPTVYFLLPAHADLQSVSKVVEANGYMNWYTEGLTLQQPAITTSKVGNQTLVRLDWTGKGSVSLKSLAMMTVKFQLPNQMVKTTSSVAAFIATTDDVADRLSFFSMVDAERVDVFDAQGYVNGLSVGKQSVVMGSMQVNITGPSGYRGDAIITDNAGTEGTDAKNDLADGTKHNIEMSSLNNDPSTLTGVTSLINLASAGDGLTLNLTGAGTVLDDSDATVKDTGASTDKAYLLYSTTKNVPAATGVLSIDSSYKRANQITDWSSVRSVVLSVPAQAAYTWYRAELPVDAPDAANQLFKQVSMPYYISTSTKRYDPGITLTDMFYDFSGTLTWDDKSDKEELRPESAVINLFNATDDTATATPVASVTISDTSSDTEKYSFDVAKSSVTATSSLADYKVAQATVPDGYTETIDGLSVTNTHRVLGPCEVTDSRIPTVDDCVYLDSTKAVNSSDAYEYATIGGGDGSTGFSSMMGADNKYIDSFLTDNAESTVKWTFSIQEDAASDDMTEVGSFVVAPGAAYTDGTWEWTDAAAKYLQGIGKHKVSVALSTSANPATVQTFDYATVEVYVPLAQVADSVVPLGMKALLADNLSANYGGTTSMGVLWSDGKSGYGVTASDDSLTPVAPDTTLQAVYNGEGMDPGAVLESGDSFSPKTGTTFKTQVVLSGDALAPGVKELLGTGTTNSGVEGALLGPSGQVGTIGNQAELAESGSTFLVNAAVNRGDMNLNLAGKSIGAPLATAQMFDDRDGTKAAFTVYVTGTIVSALPLTGSDGLGRTILLITIGTLLTAGLIAAMSWWTRRSRHSSHAAGSVSAM